MPFALLTTLYFLLAFTSFTNATCYWANSTQAQNDPLSIARDDTACFPSQTHSPCCGTGWSCLSDGVCYIKQGTSEFYYRGTCTDKTWGSQQCPGWCFAQNSNTSIPLAKCKKASGEDWYCCPGDADCDCSSGKNAVKLGNAQPTTVTVVGSTSWPGISSATATSGAGNIASGTSTVRVSATTTGSAAAAATSSDTAGSSGSRSSGGSNNTALAAGLGAGIGVAVLLLAAGGWFLFNRARKRRAAAAASASAHTSLAPPATYGPDPKPYAYGGVGAGTGNGRSSASPRPGEGYYATHIVREKDGTMSFGTQELDSERRARAEMDGAQMYARTHGAVGRHEMP